MADKNTQFYAILTNVGAAKQANADALGIPWKITQMGVGDANGAEPTPNATQKSLINEWRRAPLNQLKVDDNDPSIIVAEQVIPADIGGKWIREIGLYDEAGDLVAVANCAPTYKPLLSQGSGRTQILRMSLVVSSAANVQLKIDPSVVLATREWVTEELSRQDFKHSVLAATTGNITLSGQQTIDGVALPVGARVLVKDQNAAKDNGLYVVASGAWARSADANTSAKVTPNLLVLVERGTANGDSAWQLVTDPTISLGVTALGFEMAFGRTGIAPGTYRSVQVDKYGRVVAGTSPTTVAGYGLADVYTKTQVDNALDKKADLASPKFTGLPEAPTAEVGTSSSQIATMRALIQGLSAFGLTTDKTSRPADLDTLRGTRFFGFTHWTVGAPVEAGPYDAVGFQIESFGQRTQFAVSGGAKLQIRTDDSEDYSGFDAWTELSSVNALNALAATLTAQLELKAPLASPDLTGKPTAPTPAKGNKSKLIANTEYVQTEIAALVDSSPGSLDTLRELAAALGNDPNFATTIVNELAKKANLASPKFTGTPEAPTAPVGTNTDQLATMKALLQALASFGLAPGRSMFVDDVNSLRGTCFFGFGDKAVGAIDSGVYDAIGFQIESVGQRTQFAVPGGARLYVRTDDSSDASGFEPWAEMASLNALNLLADIVAGKAPIASPKFTGVPEVPKAARGTNNGQAASTAFVQEVAGDLVDSAPSVLNTLKKLAAAIGNDASFSSTITGLLALKAPLASPAFTGNVTVPTATKGNKSKLAASTEYVQGEIAALVDSSPSALDTLKELAAALGNDPNFATTMLNELAKKATSASPKFTGTPEAPTAPVGTNTDQLATTKGLLQALAAFGLTSGRSANVSDLDNLRGTSFFGYSNVSVGAEDTGGGYDAVGFQIEALGQRTQFGITTASKVAVRTDDSNDYSGFSPWLELATVEALKALEAQTVGMSAHFAMATPPPGWLKRNGAAVSRTTYAALFAKIGTTWGAGDGSTTFNLPDGRGSFDRGWDDGRNLDKGRAFGSEQEPANMSHNHIATVSTDGAHTHSTSFVRERITSGYVPDGGNAVFGDQESDGYQTLTTTSNGAHRHSVIISSSGESESRPHNGAYLACIKY